MKLRPITEVAAELGLSPEDVLPWGRDRAKVSLEALPRSARQGRLVLVSAITPTPPGEGKTTMAVALAMGLCKRGRRAVAALRQPSLGPVFGVKGGGTGGGEASLEPAADINLHFTGNILTMPGLPREPAARRVIVHEDGRVTGLMQGE